MEVDRCSSCRHGAAPGEWSVPGYDEGVWHTLEGVWHAVEGVGQVVDGVGHGLS